MEVVGLDDTCLKWESNGELSPVDQQRILARLSSADPLGADLLSCPMENPSPAAP
ncbi:MAG: hypothetical protein ACOYMY_10930 [Prochlorococcaceae cyanobacterium]|jgi:hypothetical protein